MDWFAILLVVLVGTTAPGKDAAHGDKYTYDVPFEDEDACIEWLMTDEAKGEIGPVLVMLDKEHGKGKYKAVIGCEQQGPAPKA